MSRQRASQQKPGSRRREWEPLRTATIDGPREWTMTGGIQTIWINDRYQVVREEFESQAFGETMVYLSIKRRDKNTVRDWRHLQQIKNELIGEECEAFEVYPATSRLVDEANQYHLWGFKRSSVRIPVGFSERLVTGPEESGAVGGRGRPRQAPFEEGLKL